VAADGETLGGKLTNYGRGKVCLCGGNVLSLKGSKERFGGKVTVACHHKLSYEETTLFTKYKFFGGYFT
jgi:hypothetical protein